MREKIKQKEIKNYKKKEKSHHNCKYVKFRSHKLQYLKKSLSHTSLYPYSLLYQNIRCYIL